MRRSVGLKQAVYCKLFGMVLVFIFYPESCSLDNGGLFNDASLHRQDRFGLINQSTIQS